MRKTQKFQILLITLSLALLPAFAHAASIHDGKIYLQVQQHGEAWYVYPVDGHRYYLGRPSDAFNIMKNLGLGVAEKDIAQIPIGLLADSGYDNDQDGLTNDIELAIGTDPNNADTDNDEYSDKTEIEKWFNPQGKGNLKKNTALINKLSGRILIQTEKHGEAWYLNPKDKKRYFLGRPFNAFGVMYNLGVGISNDKLAKIPANYAAVSTKINGQYEIKLPSGWEKSTPNSASDYLDIPIISYSPYKPDSGAAYLEILVLSGQKDYTLGNLNIPEISNTDKTSNENLIIGVKPAVKQKFKYNTTVKFGNQEIKKGAELVLDVMISTRDFLHLHQVIYNEDDIELYEDYFNQIVNSIKILNSKL